MAVTVNTFKFASSFRDLPSGALDDAIKQIYVEWSGVQSFWASLDSVAQQNKQDALYNYLIAWYLADIYPTQVVHIASNGGMPLVKKEASGVRVEMKSWNIQEGMQQLMTNTFGLRAYQMIMGAPERFIISAGSGSYPVVQPTPYFGTI